MRLAPAARCSSPLVPLLVVAAALAGAAACSRDQPPAFEPSGVEGWTGEPQVAEKLRRARREAVAEPGSAEAVGRLGMVFHAHELHAEALACYRRAMELAPEEVRWPYLAALATAETDLAAAVDDFARAAGLGPDEPAVHVGFGDALVRLGRPEEAAERYRRALELAPEATHALYGLARIAVAGDDLAAAAELLERAAALAPRHGEVHQLLARVYRRLGRDEDSERELLRAGAHPGGTRPPDPHFAAMEAEAVSSQATSRRGRQLAEAGRFAEAERAFREVLAIRPGNARDFSNLGGALAGQGRLDEAVEQYERALAVDPDDTYALNNLGMALAGKGELAGAAERLRRAVEIDPAYADAHRNLGLVLARQGRQEEAIDRYRAALDLDPSLAGARNDLATSLAGRGEVGEAMAQWRRALEIDPRELSALYNLSLALIGRGEHFEAVEQLRRGLALAPNSSRLASLLAWELATAPDPALRDEAEAERLARRVLAGYPDEAQAADVLAAALAAQGRFEEAAALAERALARARAVGPPGLAAQIAARLALYRRGQPYRQPVPGR